MTGTGLGGSASDSDVAAIPSSRPASATDPVRPLVPEQGNLDRALADREALIRLCLYALDRARSTGVAEAIERGLGQVGVTAIRPDGEAFDPSRHEAGGTLPVDDPALDGVVAETEVVGFADRGRLLRAPVVTVYSRP
jgi:molecular chaperone GrpE (heat shock protein)